MRPWPLIPLPGPSPRERGEGGSDRRLRLLLPACGEKVPEGRMRGIGQQTKTGALSDAG